VILPNIETPDYYLVWKPHHIPSSFWKEKSFLEYLTNTKTLAPNIVLPDEFGFFLKNKFPIRDYKAININEIIKNLKSEFSTENEYGLLNRLDNETAGYLYFAKSRQIYDKYKSLQKQWCVNKYYLAQVYWNPFFKTEKTIMSIDYPVMHHRFDDKRMITIKTDKDKRKWRWQIKLPKTSVELIQYDTKTNISSMVVAIARWVRHQIRLHLSSIWCPIIWDNLYGEKQKWNLHLRSLWFSLNSCWQTQ